MMAEMLEMRAHCKLLNAKIREVHADMRLEQQRDNFLSDFATIPEWNEAEDPMRTIFNFRIKPGLTTPLYRLYKVLEVSISIPPDAMGNRKMDGVSATTPPDTIEILLFGEGGNQADHPLVYDVNRYSNSIALMKDLDKIANHVGSPPESDCASESGNESEEDDLAAIDADDDPKFNN